MKNIVFLLLAVSLMFTAKAQFGTAAVISHSPSTASHVHGATDSLINADTITHIVTATAGYGFVTLQATVAKVSGTVAGKARVYQSIDGTNYNLVDSLTFTDVASQFKTFAYTGSQYVYYKIVYITSGTQASKPRTWYILRKYNNNAN